MSPRFVTIRPLPGVIDTVEQVDAFDGAVFAVVEVHAQTIVNASMARTMELRSTLVVDGIKLIQVRVIA